MSFRPPLLVPGSGSSTSPSRLGKYLLTGVLGEGAMGTVYKGLDPMILRPVAVKAIRSHLFEPGQLGVAAAERFRNEAQAAGRLSHAGIVGVYEYGEDEGNAYIAMEYVEGHGLDRYIAPPARLSEPDALCVMIQVLDALNCAHEQGVWHRDIKPNNVIVARDRKLKIADFGIARIESSALTQMTVVIGSPGYIAPERYTGQKPDHRVDLFSCGVLLYQMLTGVAPFAGSDTEAMYKVLHSEPTPPSRIAGIPECWDAIVAKALAKRPADRYATAREFRDALFCAAPWPIPAALSAEAIESVERRLADETATVLQIRRPLEQTASPRVVLPTVPTEVVPRPMSKECAGIAELVAQLAAQAQAREQRRTEAGTGGSHPHVTRPMPQESTPVLTEPSPPAGELEAAPARVGRPMAAQPSAAPAQPLAIPAQPPAVPAPPAAVPARSAAVPPSLACAPPTLMVPVPRRVPPSPEIVAKAQRVLAGHIGPIASLMVKSAASIAATREQFYVKLADLAADCVDREDLLAELSRIA
jgi:eukaryotic-like serine/threonine-protein kinase